MGFAPRLAFARSRVNRSLRTPCTISRGGALLAPQPTMPDGTVIRCHLQRDTKETRIEGASRLEEQTRWAIRFPDNTDIRANDQIAILGNIYGVVEVRNPSTFSVDTEAVSYMLYDVNGVPVYLRPNATVRVLRAAAQIGPASINVRLELPEEQRFTAMGGERLMHVLFPIGTDVRMTDDILILTYGERAAARPGPYEAQDVLPVGETGLEAVRVRVIGFTL